MALFLISFLEIIFLISLLVNANTYELVRTNYGTLRLGYFYSAKQIVLLFFIGITALVSLLIEAVAAQRLVKAADGKDRFCHISSHVDYETLRLIMSEIVEPY